MRAVAAVRRILAATGLLGVLGMFLLVPGATVATAKQEPTIVEVPRCKPDMRLVAETFATFNLEHQSIINQGQYWGLTNISGRLILISDEPNEFHRRETVLHELTHICYLSKGIRLPAEVEEAMVAQQAHELYQELFGDK